MLAIPLAHGPFYASLYAQEAAARDGPCIEPALPIDECAFDVEEKLLIFLEAPAALATFVVWILGIVQAARLHQYRWLIGIIFPPVLAVPLLVVLLFGFLLSLGSDGLDNLAGLVPVLAYLILGLMLAGPLVNLVFSFGPNLWRRGAIRSASESHTPTTSISE